MGGNTESDYLLFIDGKAIAVVEAKREENPLGDEVKKQAEDYAVSPQDWYGLRHLCGKDVDVQYMKMIASKKKGSSKPAYVPPVIPKSELKPPVVIPVDIVGKHVKHKAFGVGTITAIEGTSIAVEFDKVGLKRMGYEFCMEKKMLEFI